MAVNADWSHWLWWFLIATKQFKSTPIIYVGAHKLEISKTLFTLVMFRIPYHLLIFKESSMQYASFLYALNKLLNKTTVSHIAMDSTWPSISSMTNEQQEIPAFNLLYTKSDICTQTLKLKCHEYIQVLVSAMITWHYSLTVSSCENFAYYFVKHYKLQFFFSV